MERFEQMSGSSLMETSLPLTTFQPLRNRRGSVSVGTGAATVTERLERFAGFAIACDNRWAASAEFMLTTSRERHYPRRAREQTVGTEPSHWFNPVTAAAP